MPAAQDKSTLYEFTLPNGTTKASLPKFDYMPFDGEAYLETEGATPHNTTMFQLGLVEAIDAAVAKKIRDAKPNRKWFREFWTGWEAESLVAAGESPASDAT